MEDQIIELLVAQSKRLDSIQGGLNYHIRRTDLLEDKVEIMTAQVGYFENSTFLFLAIIGLLFSLPQLLPFFLSKK